MQISLLEISSAFIVLYAIIDILGSIPLILNFKAKGEIIKPLQASLIAYTIMVAFLYGGSMVLMLFNVDIQSFAAAGAIVLFIMALEMVLDIEIFNNAGPQGTTSIVPLAFPLIAGPGSFTALISLRAEYQYINIIIALTLNLIFVFFVLRSTDKIKNFIGEGGIYILRKFFGIILLAISVKLFTENISYLFNVDEAKAALEASKAAQNQAQVIGFSWGQTLLSYIPQGLHQGAQVLQSIPTHDFIRFPFSL